MKIEKIKNIFKIIGNWIATVDHKMFGILYLLFGTFAGLFGIWYSTVIRLGLQVPGHQILEGASHYYYTVITMHGLVMIFFSVVPILIWGFGNFIVPLQLGACKLAFPRINNFAFWLLCMSFICVQFVTRAFLTGTSSGVDWTIIYSTLPINENFWADFFWGIFHFKSLYFLTLNFVSSYFYLKFEGWKKSSLRVLKKWYGGFKRKNLKAKLIAINTFGILFFWFWILLFLCAVSFFTISQIWLSYTHIILGRFVLILVICFWFMFHIILFLYDVLVKSTKFLSNLSIIFNKDNWFFDTMLWVTFPLWTNKIHFYLWRNNYKVLLAIFEWSQNLWHIIWFLPVRILILSLYLVTSRTSLWKDELLTLDWFYLYDTDGFQIQGLNIDNKISIQQLKVWLVVIILIDFAFISIVLYFWFFMDILIIQTKNPSLCVFIKFQQGTAVRKFCTYFYKKSRLGYIKGPHPGIVDGDLHAIFTHSPAYKSNLKIDNFDLDGKKKDQYIHIAKKNYKLYRCIKETDKARLDRMKTLWEKYKDENTTQK